MLAFRRLLPVSHNMPVRAFATRSVRKRSRMKLNTKVSPEMMLELTMSINQAKNIKMNSHAAAAQARKAHIFMQGFLKKHCVLPRVLWDEMLEMYAVTPDLAKMYEYREMLEKNGYKMSERGYVAFLSAYRKLGDFDKMPKVVTEMRDAKLTVSIHAYEELLTCLYSIVSKTMDTNKRKKYQKYAINLYDLIEKNESNLQPSAKYFSLLLDTVSFPGVQVMSEEDKTQLWRYASDMTKKYKMIMPSDMSLVMLELLLQEVEKIAEENHETSFYSIFLTTLQKHNILDLNVLKTLLTSPKLSIIKKDSVLREVISPSSEFHVKLDEDIIAKVMNSIMGTEEEQFIFELYHFVKESSDLNQHDSQIQTVLIRASGSTNDMKHVMSLYNKLETEHDEKIQKQREAEQFKQIASKLSNEAEEPGIVQWQQVPIFSLQSNIFPPINIANAMVDVFISSNNPTYLIQFLYDIRARQPRRVLSLNTYMKIINFLSNTIRRHYHSAAAPGSQAVVEKCPVESDVIVKLMVHMQDDSIPIHVHVYNRLIIALAYSNRFDSALKVENLLQKAGIMPNSRTFACLYESCGVHDHMEVADILWDRMVSTYDITPDYISFLAYIRAYLNQNDLAKSVALYDMMKKEYITPDNRLVVAFLNCIIRIISSMPDHIQEEEEVQQLLHAVKSRYIVIDILLKEDKHASLNVKEIKEFEDLVDDAFSVVASSITK